MQIWELLCTLLQRWNRRNELFPKMLISVLWDCLLQLCPHLQSPVADPTLPNTSFVYRWEARTLCPLARCAQDLPGVSLKRKADGFSLDQDREEKGVVGKRRQWTKCQTCNLYLFITFSLCLEINYITSLYALKSNVTSIPKRDLFPHLSGKSHIDTHLLLGALLIN